MAAAFLAERGQTERWPGFDDQVLFEFLLDRCLLSVTAPADGVPAAGTPVFGNATGGTHITWRADRTDAT